MFLCDRTDFFEEGPRVESGGRYFWGIAAAFFAASLCTVRSLKTDAPLQREQTDEWRGWMQLLILLYHYFGYTGAYNAMRVFVSSYLWATGFGNYCLYSQGRSFTVKRNAERLYRLDFLPLLVSIALNNNWMLYYICPECTFFTALLVLSLYVPGDLRAKCGVLVLVMTLLYEGPPWVLDTAVAWLPVRFDDKDHPHLDPLHEWRFRSGLERYVWIVGMVCGATLQHWRFGPALGACGLLALSVWGYCLFPLGKLEFNAWHPYTAGVPLLAYVALRNSTSFLRERYLALCSALGKLTLETYILQFHVWMRTTGPNGSPKRLLVIVPQFHLNLLLVTVLFLLVARRTSAASKTVREYLIPGTMRLHAGLALAVIGSWGASFLFLRA